MLVTLYDLINSEDSGQTVVCFKGGLLPVSFRLDVVI